ncbi:MAG TPA: hypothetical protein DCW74_04035 [Alteromonas australica]|uniref:Uncharacterized protein n=1 Tax=Alteromonas australica TaxID=589873 RepID=A0A350P0S2_9ALTE|nr:hypothetical protein [Alteromonas australica]|tara:strand:+ start:3213 stop:4127 length:915 start_codon:yes stop_codon:yes gene_type:complete
MAEAAKKTTDLTADLEEDQGQEIEVAEEETQEEQAEQETVEEASEDEEQKDEKEEELDQYSKNVRDRISKITQKYRDEEAQRIAAVEFAQKVKEQNDELRQRLTALDQSYVGEFGTRIQSQIDAAKVSYQKAYDEGDADAMFEAQKNLSRLALEEAQVEQAKKRQEQQAAAPKQEQKQQQPQQQAAPKPDPKAEAWASKNEWFGQDQTMTYAAFGIHRQLIEDEGFDPASDEYYSELDRRVRSEFPQKFGGSKDKGPRVASAESTASKSSTKKGRRTVKLTPSQIQIAKRLNVPLEEYAKYVKE